MHFLVTPRLSLSNGCGAPVWPEVCALMSVLHSTWGLLRSNSSVLVWSEPPFSWLCGCLLTSGWWGSLNAHPPVQLLWPRVSGQLRLTLCFALRDVPSTLSPEAACRRQMFSFGVKFYALWKFSVLEGCLNFAVLCFSGQVLSSFETVSIGEDPEAGETEVWGARKSRLLLALGFAGKVKEQGPLSYLGLMSRLEDQ